MDGREKIIEILKQTSDLWKEEESHGYIVSVDLGKIADTLIEARIGDVSWWERKCKLCEEDWFLQKKQIEHYAESYKEMLQEDLDKYKHRAEVAEKDLEKHKRALRNAVWGLMTEGVYGFVAESEAELEKEIQNELEQAEREIEEENGE